jgi:hypothetical protein
MATIYYVRCILCQHEIEIQRRPPGENIATGFGVAWNVDIICPACGTKANYGYGDVRKRDERSTQPQDRAERDPEDRASNTSAKVNGEKLRHAMSIGEGLPGHAWSESSIKANAPESSGVYVVYGAVWIYIGESNDIQSRLLDLWNGDNACIARAVPTGFVFEACDLTERLRRQATLIARFRPLCNQLGELRPTPSMPPVRR